MDEVILKQNYWTNSHVDVCKLFQIVLKCVIDPKEKIFN